MRGYDPGHIEVEQGCLLENPSGEVVVNSSDLNNAIAIRSLFRQGHYAVGPDLLVIKDPKGVYLIANEAFCHLLDKPESELIGKTAFDLFPCADARAYHEDDLNVMTSGLTVPRDVACQDLTLMPFW